MDFSRRRGLLAETEIANQAASWRGHGDSRRAGEAQKEKERVRIAASEQKRNRIAELQESLTSLSKTDCEARAAALNELHELEPECPEYGQMALELAAPTDEERAVREHPEYSLATSNLSWGKCTNNQHGPLSGAGQTGEEIFWRIRNGRSWPWALATDSLARRRP